MSRVVGGTAVAIIAFAAGFAFTTLPLTARLQLAATSSTLPGGIGIPGLTKTYEAELANVGFLPVQVSVCESLNDAFEHEQTVAYAIERWQSSDQRWHLLREIPASQFCKPYPLGIVKGEIRRVWLWPRQRIPTGFIAAQAIQGIHFDDKLRFAVTPFLPTRDVRVVTSAFRVDEVPTATDLNLHIAH